MLCQIPELTLFLRHVDGMFWYIGVPGEHSDCTTLHLADGADYELSKCHIVTHTGCHGKPLGEYSDIVSIAKRCAPLESSLLLKRRAPAHATAAACEHVLAEKSEPCQVACKVLMASKVRGMSVPSYTAERLGHYGHTYKAWLMSCAG
jgi:hypothetical protein